MSKLRIILFLTASLFLSSCLEEGPGHLKGSWQMNGLPIVVIYRDDEEESMGVISKVSYKHEGNDVLLTYLSGPGEGTTIRITMIDKNNLTVGFLGGFTRIK